MAYCKSSDVKILVETTLDDELIEELIEISDADLDSMLGGSSLGTQLKKRCSMMLTAATIAEKYPRSYTVGSARIDMGTKIRDWRSQVRDIVARVKAGRAVIKSSKYQHIDEDVRYPS